MSGHTDDAEPAEVADFDAFWAEHTAAEQREKVRVCGELVPVPTDLTLEQEQRLSTVDSSNESEVEALITELFGAGTLDRWTAAGMTTRQLAALLAWSLMRARGQRISFAEAAERADAAMGDDGEGKAGNRKERRAAASRKKSSATGPR